MDMAPSSQALSTMPQQAVQASQDLQRALLAMQAAQSTQTANIETMLSVLDFLGIGNNLDTMA